MEITASMVKELREMTGAGVMACKKALVETDGDFDKAIELLREKGEATAIKKAGRIAAEGTVLAIVEGNKSAIVEVNSETDFVAKNDKFRTFVANVAEQILASDAKTVEELSEEKFIKDDSKTVKEELISQIAVIGENMSIRRFEKIVTDGVVVPYIHGGGRIGVLVEASADVVNDEVTEALKNVAMQIAALNPKYTSRDEVSEEFIAHEKEILLAQIKNDPKEASKPEKVIEGMVNGRINKEMKEICLLDQVYVKAEDGKQSVANYIAEVSKATGSNLAVKRFVRFETGEGLEKKNENFAEEVAKQMGN
ncbi:MAG: translation elongation factor Ts [Lachnospiraceae bacterium]|nr:translation elongation factor Ts [Lachnospiraceae bacterium]MDE6699004.1 translation elongation factor Ts [Lachnospiraceae bacterium]